MRPVQRLFFWSESAFAKEGIFYLARFEEPACYARLKGEENNSKMLIKLMKAKLHWATVTQADLHYEGSIAIDEALLEASGILPFEAVHVWDVTNGARFETYAITLPRDSREVCVNGAAARLVQTGDRVIVASFCWMEQEQAREFKPGVILLGEKNQILPDKK
jgi:aspartate 1-decarboxylase